MPITARVITNGRNVIDASGKSCRQYRNMPNVPTLSTTAIISTAVAGVASTAESGSQRWNGHRGAFTAKANMNPRNKALSTAGLAPNSPRDAAPAMARKSNVPPSGSAVTTYRPITAASMMRPPNRLYSRNFTAARDLCSPPNPPIRKYIGISMISNST